MTTSATAPPGARGCRPMPGWQSYVQKARPLILAQTNRILNPAPFFTPE